MSSSLSLSRVWVCIYWLIRRVSVAASRTFALYMLTIRVTELRRRAHLLPHMQMMLALSCTHSCRCK